MFYTVYSLFLSIVKTVPNTRQYFKLNLVPICSVRKENLPILPYRFNYQREMCSTTGAVLDSGHWTATDLLTLILNTKIKRQTTLPGELDFSCNSSYAEGKFMGW